MFFLFVFSPPLTHLSAETSQSQNSSPNVSLDVRDADLREIFTDLARKGQINLLLSPKIAGRLTCRVSDMDPLELIRFLARANGLSFEDHGSIKMILVEDAPPTHISFEIIPLQNAKAAEVSKMIESLKLDKRSHVTHDTEGNRLIIVRED
ncbi:MAG: hypothetical protein WA705_24170 [Candidatus Ozemobacteraceae bacterium]